MSGMKISLDAAMRARDVSSVGRADDPLDRDEPEKAATAGGIVHAGTAEDAVSDLGATEGKARQPAGSEASGPAESEPTGPAGSEASRPAESPAADSARVGRNARAVGRAARKPFAGGQRRRRRRRLQRGDPT